VAVIDGMQLSGVCVNFIDVFAPGALTDCDWCCEECILSETERRTLIIPVVF